MSLSATINLILKAIQTTADEFGTPSDTPLFTFPATTLANGTAAGQINVMHHSRLTLAGTTAQTLDLVGGLTEEFGTTVNIDKMKVMAFYNRSSQTNLADIVTIGAAAANTWNGWTGVAGSTFKVGPGGMALFVNPNVDGYPVTAGTGDQLKIVNGSTNNVSLDIFFLGVDA